MGKALYRTYRSKKLSEIVGQEHITTALSNALKSGAISHAYLFTGPRGVGKTSIARILAHEINGLPYDDDATHLDIIEIDAASNRRIDEIRDLRDKVHIAPTSAKYKVYIIDEVHMLTREAFNALLKTLEEPPAHAVFILATTEAHKLPETIVSRTQRFTFKPVDLSKVAAHLKDIAKKEKIAIDDAALAMIAAHGEGSFRDSISLLDQTRSVGHKVTATDVEALLGVAPAELVTTVLQYVAAHDAASVVQALAQLYQQGADPAQVAKQLSAQLREQLLAGRAILPGDQLITLLTKLLEVAGSADARALLEITLLDIALSGTPQPIVELIPPATPRKSVTKSALASHQSETVAAPQSGSDRNEAAPSPATVREPTRNGEGYANGITAEPGASGREQKGESTAEAAGPVSGGGTEEGTGELDQASWAAALAIIKKGHSTLYSFLRSAELQSNDGVITLVVGTAFNKKIITKSENKKIIGQAISNIIGRDVAFECKIGKVKPAPQSAPEGEISHAVSAPSTSEPPAEAQDYYANQADQEAAKRPISTVNNIFGGGELLQS
ncbi:MAG TPA: DNA polymerase III subunit gamma/tau [Candidatus Saccharimonadales bacterium]|nr:DNA polymerase III subunit gamma/tau [Candidatus Saccharimonadales bacterium]